jgi:autotransporter-associated beta strand protein
MRRLPVHCLLAATVALCFARAGLAQTTYNWTAATASLWGTPANWNPGTTTTGPGSQSDPTNNDIAVFGVTGTSTTVQFNFGAIGTPRYVGTIQLSATDVVARTFGSNSATAGVLILNGTGANNLILDDSSTAPMTFAPQAGGGTGPMTIQLVQSNSTISSIAGTTSSLTGLLTISANVGEGATPSGITKAGNGILLLSGTNSFTGPTTVSGGFIQYTVPASLYGGNSANWTTTNLVVQPGAAMIFRVGGTGFATTDFDNLKTLGSATGGFLNGSAIGIDTGNGSQTYAGNIGDTNSGANSLGFHKFGANTLTLTGANAYTGGTFVRTGTLAVSGGTASLPTGGNVTIGDPTAATTGATLNLGAAAQASPSSYTLGSVTVGGSTSGTGNLISISGNTTPNTTSVAVNGTFTLVRGTVNTIPNATLTLNGPLVLASTPGSGATTFNATFNVGNGTGGMVTYASSTPISFSAQQSGGNAGFLGSRLNINAGLLTIGTSINEDPNFTANSTGTAQLTFQNAATLQLSGSVPVLLTRDAALTQLQPTIMLGAGAGSPAVAGVINTNGFGTAINTPITSLTATPGALSVIGGGSLTITGQNSHIGGVTLAAGTTLNINNSGVAAQAGLTTSFASGASTMAVPAAAVPNLVLGQRLTGTGIAAGTFIRTIDPIGNTITINQNTTTAGTSINAGATSSLGTGTFTINGGTIDNTSGGPVTLATNNVQNWAGDFAFSGTNDLNLGTGAVAMTASRVVTANGGVLTVGGAIGDGGSGFALTKAGAGTLALAGASTYTGGTIVNSGTLQLLPGSISAGPVTANGGGSGGGMLRGTGTVAGLAPITGGTVPGTLRPGNSVGTLTLSN